MSDRETDAQTDAAAAADARAVTDEPDAGGTEAAALDSAVAPDFAAPETDVPDLDHAEALEDPFAGWPAAESSSVIEEQPAEGMSVEHVRGEVQVPDGFTVLEGTPLGKRRSVGVVVSRFNGGVTDK